jgi:hypothetical protein
MDAAQAAADIGSIEVQLEAIEAARSEKYARPDPVVIQEAAASGSEPT